MKELKRVRERPPEMPLGRYVGRELRYIPSAYLRYALARMPWLTDTDRLNITKELDRREQAETPVGGD